MKKTGVVILLMGLLFTVFATFGILVKEHITDPGKIKAAQVKIHRQIWEPLLGAMVVIAGVGIYMVGKSREAKSNVSSSTG